MVGLKRKLLYFCLNEKDRTCLKSLLDKEIENYQDVHDRTGRAAWLVKVNELKKLKNKII